MCFIKIKFVLSTLMTSKVVWIIFEKVKIKIFKKKNFQNFTFKVIFNALKHNDENIISRKEYYWMQDNSNSNNSNS